MYKSSGKARAPTPTKNNLGPSMGFRFNDRQESRRSGREHVEPKTKKFTLSPKYEDHAKSMPGIQRSDIPRNAEENEQSAIDKGIDEVLEYLVNGVAALWTMLFGYLVVDRAKLFRGLAVEEICGLAIYVENTVFKLGKATATNAVLGRCVDVMIQTMHFTHDELEQTQGSHRIELANMKVEQDELQKANTTLTVLLNEYRAEIRAAKSERDDAFENIDELNDELGEAEQAMLALREECNQWHQKFTVADSKRLAAKKECDRLLNENDRLNQRLIGEINRQKFEEVKRKMEEFERQEVEAARRKRKEQQRKQREEEEKQRQEEKRRKEEEERKRKAHEKAEQEKWAREAATAAEEERCRQRDAMNWGKEPWTSDAALKRFRVVAEEFTSTKYSVDSPVTLRSVPWPVLNNPSEFALEELNWKSVEGFLRHARRFYAGEDSATYAKLLKQIQLMFHPDKWSSRNLLVTVIDAELRDGLRQAGKVVSQAVNQWIYETGRSRD